MTRKTIRIIFPTLAGIFLAVIYLQIRSTALEYLYPENCYDAPLLFEPLFDIEVFFPIYVIAYFAAVTFQFFIGLRVWETYKQGQKIFNLRLWQLMMISCVLFGIGFGLIVWYSRMGIQDLLFKNLAGTILALNYWIGNLTTLFFIDKKKYGSHQKYLQ